MDNARQPIGGQAVMEGVMMNGERNYSVAVRLPKGVIRTKLFHHTHSKTFDRLIQIPFLRGVLRFGDSLAVGIKTLNYSADCYMEDDSQPPASDDTNKESSLSTLGIMAVGILLAIALFVLLPQGLSRFVYRALSLPVFVLGLLEGLTRMIVFLIYLLLISRVKDVARLFMYHGAEHKCIACYEKKLPLTMENVQKQSRFHKRCGTSFIFIVMLVSMLVFAFVPVTGFLLRFLLHLLLIPVVAGIAYELMRLSSRSRSAILNALVMPGIWIQHLTTKEPEPEQIEVGILSVMTLLEKEHPEYL